MAFKSGQKVQEGRRKQCWKYLSAPSTGEEGPPTPPSKPHNVKTKQKKQNQGKVKIARNTCIVSYRE